MTYSKPGATVPLPDSCGRKNHVAKLLRLSLGLMVTLALTFGGTAAAQDTITLYIDIDNDGYGNPLDSIITLVPLPGFVTNAADCNDFDASINPEGVDLCDGIDRNCDGIVSVPPVLTLVPSDTLSCEGNIVVITAYDENNEQVWVEWNTGNFLPELQVMLFEDVNIFSAIYTAPNGCSATDTTAIYRGRYGYATLMDEPSPIICPGDQAMLVTEVVGSDGPWVLTYSDGTNTFDVVQTTTLDTIYVYPEVTTTYELIGISDNSCGGVPSGSHTVKVQQRLNIAPIHDITVAADNNCSATVNIKPVVTGTPTPSYQILIGGSPVSMPYVFGLGSTVVEIVATNACATIRDSLIVTVQDQQAPVFTTTQENITLNNDPGVCGAMASWSSPQASDNCGLADITLTAGLPSGSLFPEGTTTVTYVAVDSSGNQSTQSFTVTVNNAAPVLSDLQASPATVNTGATVNVTAKVDDTNLSGVSINWGDNSTTSASVSSGNVSGSHVYNQAGTFTIAVTGTDACNATHTVTTTVTVNKPAEEEVDCHITANGWFNSPKNAYSNCKNATGKAHFNIHAKSKNGGQIEGKATLNFQAGDLQFDSKNLLTLTCSGNRAVLTGNGDLNCKSGYRFMVIMEDEDNGNGGHHGKKGKGGGKGCDEEDKLRFKIWNANNVLVYDNQRGASDSATPPEINGGSIIFHKKGKNNAARMASNAEGAEQFAFETKVTAYPNPFTSHLTVQFHSDVEESVNIHLLDITGNVVYNKLHDYSYEGAYEVEVGNASLSGEIYLVKIEQGIRSEVIKVARK